MDRRLFIGSGIALGTASLAWSRGASAMQAAPAAAPAPAPTGPFTLPNLPYAFEALEPSIDTMTMQIHHGKHHKLFVDNLNIATAADASLNLPVEDLLANVSTLPTGVRNAAGGHYNHTLFWTLLAPVGQGGEPSAALSEKITADFGSMDAFKTQMNAAATTRFGSGWAWLIVKDGKLAITSTPNQDNPLMDLAETRGAPILGVDVWEHAYYLKYQNRRADYLKAWWDVVNWNTVNGLFDTAMA